MNDLPGIPIDRENAFMLYAAFTGDVERTAAALGVRAVDVLRLVDDEDWTEKLKPILDLKKSSKPGDIERGINRALNFVQAHKLRMFLERVVSKLCGMDAEELKDYLFTAHTVKEGEPYCKLTTRALADLASAVEKAHALTYMALNDTAQDRSKRNESDGGGSAGDMHVKIAEAMQKAAQSKTPRAQLFDAQIEVAQLTIEAAKKPEPVVSPYDKD